LAINVIQLIATVLSIPLITKYGRRPIILAGNFGTAACSLAIGFFFLVANMTQNYKIVIGSLVFIVLFMIIYGLTIGPTVWLYVP
jgi:MFS family permease